MARLHCGDRAAIINPGEGMFVNANVLHSVTDADPAHACHMVTIVFSASLIAGLPQGVCQQKFIEPLESCKTLPYIHFLPHVPWHAEVLDALSTAFAAYQSQTFGFELIVLEQLTGVCRRIITENRAKLHIAKTGTDDERIKQMLVFIQQHYEEKLALSEIAASAHISKRACTRCFQEKLHVTPFQYLHAVRIRVAAEMLRHSENPVGEIADAVGFADNSYFAKVFKATLGCSPRAYRIRHADLAAT